MESSTTLEDFLSDINRNLYKLINAEKIMEILNKNLKLSSIDIVNRIIIAITYDKEIVDIKTEKEWQLYGRKVLNSKDEVLILIPVEDSDFIDTETKENIDLTEFNTFEIEKAIEYGIIEKVKNVKDFQVGALYDIKNTISIDNNAYKLDKVKSDLSSLVKVFVKLTKAKVEKLTDDNRLYYSKSENTLFIPQIDYNSVIIQLSNIIFDILVDYNIEEYAKNHFCDGSFNKNELELIREASIFSIASMYDAYNTVKFNKVFNNNRNISTEDIIRVLIISDDIAYKVVQYTKDSNGNNIDDIVNNALIAEKAEKLLNIATASALYNKLLH